MGAMASQITNFTIVYSKLHITGLCVAGEFPTQRASNAENASIWWSCDSTSLISEAVETILGVNVGDDLAYLTRVAKYLDVRSRRTIYRSFVSSDFKYCP